MKEEFPSPREQIAASALLLLSAKTDSPFCFDDDDAEFVKEKKCKCNSAKESSVVLSDSKSCCSSLSSENSFSDQINKHPLRIVTPVSRLLEMKFEVVRKVRSKYYRISDGREFTSINTAAVISPGSVSGNTETSCLSSSSGEISSAARSRNVTRESRRKHGSSAYMRRRAEAILRLLAGGCASEVRIRQLLGDSPDTSKALRMLLKLEEIKRSGAGGRADPFIYTIA